MAEHDVTAARKWPALLGLSASLTIAACMDSLDGAEANRPPVAVARVAGQIEMGSQVTVPFTGAPVQITLDGSGSSDAEGPLKAYRWFSGTPSSGPSGAGEADEDAGSASGGGRWVPAGAPKDWPDDVVNPVVTLGEGQYSFVLWVIDEKDVVSDPSTLTITVAVPLDPVVQSCVDNVIDTVPMECKVCVCGVSDACRAAAVESVCNADCWGLISCIGSNCPDFVPGGDTSCVVGSCARFLAGAGSSMMVAPCLRPCEDSCRAE